LSILPLRLLLTFDPLSFINVVEVLGAISCEPLNFEPDRDHLFIFDCRGGGGPLLFDHGSFGCRRGLPDHFSRTFVFGFGCRRTGHDGGDQHKKDEIGDKDFSLFHSD
jgi:hypothetical protein